MSNDVGNAAETLMNPLCVKAFLVYKVTLYTLAHLMGFLARRERENREKEKKKEGRKEETTWANL